MYIKYYYFYFKVIVIIFNRSVCVIVSKWKQCEIELISFVCHLISQGILENTSVASFETRFVRVFKK